VEHPERAGGQEYAIGDQRMDVRVEGDEVAEGLHVKNESGLTPRFHCFEAGPQQAGKAHRDGGGGGERTPYQLRQCEHVLAMRYRGEQILFQPLTVSEHPLRPHRERFC
jgi:hypothetical protein